MEILRIYEHLSLIDVIVMLSDTDQLKLQSIWSVNFRCVISMFEKIIWLNFSVFICPSLLSQEEFLGISPRLHLNELISIFAKTLRNQLIRLTNFNAVKIVAIRSHTSNVDHRRLNRASIALLNA